MEGFGCVFYALFDRGNTTPILLTIRKQKGRIPLKKLMLYMEDLLL